ncbi:hypothetical protein P8C59_004102 [Phyllachora maydis]|uniref:Spindle pole body component n=1 Tax=Phyllachora maydis TaxID=1825666 RepID=A0AAD9I1P8_9PEZI|nr:hypothetical protein P8C59_004102 [Phyllachora maydis]
MNSSPSLQLCPKVRTEDATQPFEVDEHLGGLVERLRVTGREALGDALARRLQLLAPLKSRWTPEILHLLLELSDQPAEKTKIDSLHSLHEPEEDPGPALTWAEIAEEDGWDEDRALWRNVNFDDNSDDDVYEDIVITEEGMRDYQAVFTFLLQIKRAFRMLLHRHAGVAESVDDDDIVDEDRLYYLIRAKLLWFCNSIMSYVALLVITPYAAVMREGLIHAVDVDEMIEVHARFTERLRQASCLGPKLKPIHDCILDMLDLTVKLEDAHRIEALGETPRRLAYDDDEEENMRVDMATPALLGGWSARCCEGESSRGCGENGIFAASLALSAGQLLQYCKCHRIALGSASHFDQKTTTHPRLMRTPPLSDLSDEAWNATLACPGTCHSVRPVHLRIISSSEHARSAGGTTKHRLNFGGEAAICKNSSDTQGDDRGKSHLAEPLRHVSPPPSHRLLH